MIWCAGRYNDEDLPSTFFQSCITHPSFLDNSCSHLNENDLNVYKKEINSYYDDIVNSFLLAVKHISKEIKRKNKKYEVIPGWHEYVQEHHAHARHCYKQWRIMGSPNTFLRQGLVTEIWQRRKHHN